MFNFENKESRIFYTPFVFEDYIYTLTQDFFIDLLIQPTRKSYFGYFTYHLNLSKFLVKK